MSLQMHHHRAEHWIVRVGKRAYAREEVFCWRRTSPPHPDRHPHRIENPGKITLYMIEVQSGLISPRMTSCGLR